jgi:hypothetical protein
MEDSYCLTRSLKERVVQDELFFLLRTSRRNEQLVRGHHRNSWKYRRTGNVIGTKPKFSTVNKLGLSTKANR